MEKAAGRPNTEDAARPYLHPPLANPGLAVGAQIRVRIHPDRIAVNAGVRCSDGGRIGIRADIGDVALVTVGCRVVEGRPALKPSTTVRLLR